MSERLSYSLDLLFRSCAVLFVANEIRGAVLAVPILYAMYEAGGTLMAWWLAFCSLAGIGLSVVVPMVVASRLRKFLPQTSAGGQGRGFGFRGAQS